MVAVNELNNEMQPTDRFPRVKSDRKKDAKKQISSKNTKNDSENKIKDWLAKGIEHLESRRFQEAISFFEKVLKEEPDNLTAYEKITIARSILADIESAADYLSMGRECIRQKDWRGAADELQIVLSIQPDNKEARELLIEVSRHVDGIEIPPLDPETQVNSESASESAAQTAPQFEEFDIGSKNEDIQEPAQPVGEAESKMKLDTYYPDESTASSGDSDFTKRIEQAISLYEDGEFQKAGEILTKLNSDYPEHSQVKYYLQILNRKLKDTTSSRNQEDAEKLFKLGMDHLDKENFSDAINCFQEALKKKPDFRQAKMMLAKTNSLLKPKIQAQPSSGSPQRTTSQRAYGYRIPARKSSAFPVGLILGILAAVIVIGGAGYFFMVKYPQIRAIKALKEAESFFNDKEYKKVLQKTEEVLKVNPEMVKAYELNGLTYMALNNGGAAAQNFKSALKLDPKNSSLLMKLGDAYLLDGNYRSAEKQYSKASSDENYEVMATYDIGICKEKMGKRDEAVAAFRHAIELNPDFAKAHFELAKLLSSEEDKTEAESEFQLAIEKEPKFLDAYRFMARFYLDSNQPAKAVEVLKTPLTWLRPTNTEQAKIVKDFRRLLAETYIRMKDYKSALDQYNKMLEIEEDAGIYVELGKIYFRLHRYQQAILAWENAEDLNPKDADINFNLGTIYVKMHKYKKAYEEFQNAINKNPDHSKAYANMGFLFYKQYKFNQAVGAWKRSLAIDPDQPNIRKKIKEIENMH